MPIQLPATGAGSGSGTGGTAAATDALVVAAVDAPADVVAAASYVCDGTNDHIEITQALVDAQMYTTHNEPFAGSSGNMLGTIFPANSIGVVGTWGCLSDKAKVTSGENGTNICRFSANGFFHAEYQFITGFEYACDLTWRNGTAGIYFAFTGATTNSSIDGVAFVLDGVNAKIIEGSNQTLAASTVRATTTWFTSSGGTQRISFSYKGNNRFVAKINGAVFHDITIASPTHDYNISYTAWTPLTFHTTTSNNEFDNFAYGKLWGSRPVRLSPGRFKLGSTVKATAKSAQLSGAGKRETFVDVTALAASTAAMDFSGTDPTVRSFCVIGRSADGTVNSASGAGTIIFRNMTSRLEGVWFYLLNAAKAVSLDDATGRTWVEVRDCQFENNDVACVGLFNDKTHAEYVLVDGCDFRGHGDCVRETGGGSYGMRLVDNKFRTNDGYGIYLSYTAQGGQVGPSIVGNYFICGNSAIRLDDAFGAVVTGNMITESSGHGVHMYRCWQNVVSGNTVMWNDFNGIFLEGSSSCTVSGNQIAENGMDGATPNWDNIAIASSSEATPTRSDYNNIDGNTIRRSNPNDANAYYGYTPRFGIRIAAGTANKLTNNDIHQSGFVGDISDSGTSTVNTGNRT